MFYVRLSDLLIKYCVTVLQKRVVIIHINKALAWIARLLYKFAKVFAAIIIIIVIYRYAETAIVQVNKMVNICLLSV